jgi:hypothetical protein
VPGPFYVPGAASRDDGASIASEPAGMPASVHGRVLDLTDAASPYSDSDAVSAVKPTLLRTFVERNPLDPARPPGLDGPWCSVETDIVLAGATGD